MFLPSIRMYCCFIGWYWKGCAYQMITKISWCRSQRPSFGGFFTDWFCHLVDRGNYFRTVWIRRMCHWGSHLAWLEHQPLGLLIWNSTRDCLPVSHVIHLHELGGAGQIIEKFSDTLQQMCWQHPFLSTPGSTHVTPLKYTPCRAMAYSVCTSCGPFVI